MSIRGPGRKPASVVNHLTTYPGRSLRRWLLFALVVLIAPQVVGATGGFITQRRDAQAEAGRARAASSELAVMGSAQTAISDVEDAVVDQQRAGSLSDVESSVDAADARVNALSGQPGLPRDEVQAATRQWARARITLLDETAQFALVRARVREAQGALGVLAARELARLARVSARHAESTRHASVVRAVPIGLVILGTLLAAQLLWVGIRRALRTLQDSAGRFAAGDLDHRVKPARFSELTHVGEALNTMAERLDRSRHDLIEQANHDALTGLPNRRMLYERVREALESGPAGSVGLLLIDIDDFKSVNDSLGHTLGEQVLVETGRRVADAVRPDDVVARLGGDEFAVLVERLDEPLEAEAIAERVLLAYAAPMIVEGRELGPTASVGVVVSEPGMDAEALVRAADLAMYGAKADGKRGYRRYRPAMLEGALERLELEGALKRAVESDAIELHYQPILQLGGDRVIGVESLARWTHPDRGSIPPDRFIPLAEQTGVIVPLGRNLLARACRDVPRLRDCFGARVRVGVNLSAHELLQRDLPAFLVKLLAEHALAPRTLTIEITESVLLRDLSAARRRLDELHDIGVGLALDDFGTGYSSLAYLRHLPVDILKIDKTFVANVADPASGDRVVVEAILNLARPLGLLAVAEGIEEPGQRDALEGLGCPLGQGYLFSRPLPLEELEHRTRAAGDRQGA